MLASERRSLEDVIARLGLVKRDLASVEETPAVTFRDLDACVEELAKLLR
jgi:hypothetical protein